MSRGGARNRSGPQPDPKSIRSAARNLNYAPLPAEGYDGAPPDWPLPSPTDRELELWVEAWRSPQAAAWSSEPWRWHAVAMWVRISAICEDRDVSASHLAQVHRFADQIGMTPAGLKENGWTIAAAGKADDEVGNTDEDEESNVVDMFRALGGSA